MKYSYCLQWGNPVRTVIILPSQIWKPLCLNPLTYMEKPWLKSGRVHILHFYPLSSGTPARFYTLSHTQSAAPCHWDQYISSKWPFDVFGGETPWWPSRLRTQHCHCYGSGYCRGSGWIPCPGTSACCGHSPNTQTNKNWEHWPNHKVQMEELVWVSGRPHQWPPCPSGVLSFKSWVQGSLCFLDVRAL